MKIVLEKLKFITITSGMSRIKQFKKINVPLAFLVAQW